MRGGKSRGVSFSKSWERRWWVNTLVWKGDGVNCVEPLIILFGSHEYSKNYKHKVHRKENIKWD